MGISRKLQSIRGCNLPYDQTHVIRSLPPVRSWPAGLLAEAYRSVSLQPDPLWILCTRIVSCDTHTHFFLLQVAAERQRLPRQSPSDLLLPCSLSQ